MTTKPFSTWALELAPSWLAGPVGELYVRAIGLWHDMIAENAFQAAKAHLMRADTFMPTTLPIIGKERLMPKYNNETDEQYRGRLLDAWDAWEEAGTPNSEQDQLALNGIGSFYNFQGQVGQFPDGDFSGVAWNWDDETSSNSNPTNWSRFWPEFVTHPFTDDGVWGDPGLWGDTDGTWGSNATLADVNRLREILKRWKAGHTIFQHIIVVLDAAAWDLVRPIKAGDRYDIIENRSDAAIYWDGYGKRDPSA